MEDPMTRPRSTLASAGALFLMLSLAAACGVTDHEASGDAGTSSDGAVDGATDSGARVDGGADAGGELDAGVRSDAGMDAGLAADAGRDAGMDSGADAGRDAGMDSGPVVSGLPVTLGTAGNFAILAKTGISTVPASAITGNIGVSPAAATYLTGFSLTLDSTTTFATSTQVVGHVFAADYTPPTPSHMNIAVLDMQAAFTDAAGRAPDVTELGAGDIGGMTLPAGVYKWGTGLLIPTNVTLTGSATDVWIFQIADNLTVSNGVRIELTGGALPKNVFWQVSGMVDVGTTAHCEGIFLSQTAITLATGATVNGRLLAQTAVNLDTATVVQPAP
jgi:hypothetical protein